MNLIKKTITTGLLSCLLANCVHFSTYAVWGFKAETKNVGNTLKFTYNPETNSTHEEFKKKEQNEISFWNNPLFGYETITSESKDQNITKNSKQHNFYIPFFGKVVLSASLLAGLVWIIKKLNHK